MASNNDDFARIVEFPNTLQRLAALGAGKPDIEQHHVNWFFSQRIEARLTALHGSGQVAFVGQDTGQGVANSSFVVNDEDAMHVGRWPLPAWVREQSEVRR